jgi:CHAT domain-containing protein
VDSKQLVWGPLPATQHEEQQVAALARQALGQEPLERTGSAASTSQLLVDLPRVRYAHLATHGFFADERFRSVLQVDPQAFRSGTPDRAAAGQRNPLVLSGLALAGADLPPEKAAPDRGIVTAEALANLDLDQLELAVLSACETGLGEVAGGEGVFGLQRAFHLAGTHHVIASLWKVDDQATAALMTLFYHQLWREGRAPVVALHQAQLALYRHPERIPELARLRGTELDPTVLLPSDEPGAPEPPSRAPIREWAAFLLCPPTVPPMRCWQPCGSGRRPRHFRTPGPAAPSAGQ